MTTEYQNIKVV